jgi:predicted 2-oxoglutarate/Fe(II)-dependent dioxygenase YbiX
MIYQQKLFNEEECDLIKSYVKLQPAELSKYFNTTGFFNIIDGNKLVATDSKTSYRVFVIENTSKTEWMFNKLIKWFSDVNNIGINYNNKVESCTLHQYSVGDKFSKHIDLMKGFDTRRYNLGIQLSDSYEGGEYVCWDDNDNEVLISKQTGTALSYHGRIWHEIKEITNGERLSIVMPIYKHHIIEKTNLI